MITGLFGPAFAWAVLTHATPAASAALPLTPGSTAPAVAADGDDDEAPSPLDRLLRRGAGLRRPPPRPAEAPLDPDDLDDAPAADDLDAIAADPFEDLEEEP